VVPAATFFVAGAADRLSLLVFTSRESAGKKEPAEPGTWEAREEATSLLKFNILNYSSES
jgi:hypothetical protein